jgi:hypothetical protein
MTDTTDPRERRLAIVPTGDVNDGPEEVATYFQTTRNAFPASATRTRSCASPTTRSSPSSTYSAPTSASCADPRDWMQLPFIASARSSSPGRQRPHHLRAHVLRPSETIARQRLRDGGTQEGIKS